VSAFALVPNPLRDPQVRGRVFEALAFRHLRDVARRLGGSLSFVRQDGAEAHEADFVLERREEAILVEVTAAARVRSRKAASARRAGKHTVHQRRVVVHGGAETVQQADCAYVSIRDFLMRPDATVLGGSP
jgi:predicted AAA+ superfamily ATPase